MGPTGRPLVFRRLEDLRRSALAVALYDRATVDLGDGKVCTPLGDFVFSACTGLQALAAIARLYWLQEGMEEERRLLKAHAGDWVRVVFQNTVRGRRVVVRLPVSLLEQLLHPAVTNPGAQSPAQAPQG